MGEDDKREHKGVSGFLSSVTDLLERLDTMAQSGTEITRSGTIPAPKGERGERGTRGVYGFSLRVGAGDQGFKVEPFGNVRRDRSTGESVVEEVREPLVDVFDEDDRVLIVAELPGIEPEDVQLELHEGVLDLSAERSDRKYRKSIEVPAELRREGLSVTCRNGIVEITAEKPHP